MQISAGDTAWVMASAALVFLMVPGLAFFYGGMVRAKNVLGMLAQNFITIGVVGVLWVLFTYSLAFGKGNGFIGDLHQFGLGHMSEMIPGFSSQTIPTIVFVAFQAMFAIITPALITGASADRLKLGGWIAFLAIWSIVVYTPVAHWIFSPQGWLFQRGAEDFAGGAVIHANAGAAALALVLILGRRTGWPRRPMRPHNVPLILLGAGLLWFGWFGFNAGSALAANNLAGFAFVNTLAATCAAMLGWLATERIRDGHATTLGAASGLVAGLVAVTPAAGFVSPVGALAIGVIAGVVCCLALSLKFRFGFDDSLDVVAVHLVGGVLGALLIGFFGSAAINGRDGLFYGGGFDLLGDQALAVGAAVGYSFVATLIIAFVLDRTMGLRVSADQEAVGLDQTQHAESAYELEPTSIAGMPTMREPITEPITEPIDEPLAGQGAVR